MTFEWDIRKALSNRRKHPVEFEEASSVFLDPLAMTYPDPANLSDEIREIASEALASESSARGW